MFEPLETDRLVLRPFGEADREQAIRLLRNDEISKTYMLPEFEDDSAAESVFRHLLSLSQQEHHFVRAICLENRLIGFLNDVEIKGGTVELGYVIHPDDQNQGYATEALKASIWELFQRGYRAVQAGYFEENPASGRVMEKSGMHPISKSEDITYRGIVHHCLYYELENPIKTLGTHIRYLPAAEEPLSAEVYCIQGKNHTYLYDVGNNNQSLSFIRSVRNLSTAILSHPHKDHTGNVLKTKISTVYVGDRTQEILNFGTIVNETIELEEGIIIIPCPSVHTSGSLLLNVYGEYCLIGDLFYHRPPVNPVLVEQMLEALAGIDTSYFVSSHGCEKQIYPKDLFVAELRKEFEKE